MSTDRLSYYSQGELRVRFLLTTYVCMYVYMPKKEQTKTSAQKSGIKMLLPTLYSRAGISKKGKHR
jgi:hypothetical protein